MEEEEELKPKKVVPERKLEPLSIEELHDYIAERQAEIERAREMITAKQVHRGGAEELFKR
jgi:uncharacterized small protein (DUF1192 family)